HYFEKERGKVAEARDPYLSPKAEYFVLLSTSIPTNCQEKAHDSKAPRLAWELSYRTTVRSAVMRGLAARGKSQLIETSERGMSVAGSMASAVASLVAAQPGAKCALQPRPSLAVGVQSAGTGAPPLWQGMGIRYNVRPTTVRAYHGHRWS